MNDRAQSIGIVHFFLSLIVGALIYWVVSLISEPILLRATEATTNPEANQATQWFTDGVAWLPIFFLICGFFGLIAYSVFRSEVRV